MWTCEGCGRTVRNNDFACDLCLRAKPGSDPALADKAAHRDLVTEAHFKALALWFRVGGGVMAGLLTVAALYFMAAGSSLGRSFGGLGHMVGAAVWIGYTLIMMYCGLYFVVGHFLARYHNWARIVTVIITLLGASFSLISLVWAEIATAGMRSSYGGYGYARHIGPGFGDYFRLLVQIAWAAAITKTLLGAHASKIVRPEYRAIVEETKSLKPNMFRSPFFVFPAIAVGIAVLILLFAMLMLLSHSSRY